MGMEWGATLVRSISLDFLGVGPFCREGHPHEVWISLDFLGFSRPNRDFSMGYAAKSVEIFFSRFPGRRAAPERKAWGRGHAEAHDHP